MKRLERLYMDLRRNKKAGLEDIATIMVILLVVGVFFLIGGKLMDALNTGLSGSGLLTTEGTNAVAEINNLYPTVIDNGFLYLMVGLCLVALILAMMVAIHPVFFVFYIIMLTIIVFISGVLSNIYQEMAADAQLSSIAAKLVWTSHILEYLPFIIGVFGFVLAIVMYRTYQNA